MADAARELRRAAAKGLTPSPAHRPQSGPPLVLASVPSSSGSQGCRERRWISPRSARARYTSHVPGRCVPDLAQSRRSLTVWARCYQLVHDDQVCHLSAPPFLDKILSSQTRRTEISINSRALMALDNGWFLHYAKRFAGPVAGATVVPSRRRRERTGGCGERYFNSQLIHPRSWNLSLSCSAIWSAVALALPWSPLRPLASP